MTGDNNYIGVECYRGDIFYVVGIDKCMDFEKKTARPAIIVSNDRANRYAPNVTVVPLTTHESKPLPTHAAVVGKVPSTALCENIQTVSKSRLNGFIRTCTTSEMQEIDRAITCALGMDEHIETPEREVSDPVVETERDIYKKLYEQLLERVTMK